MSLLNLPMIWVQVDDAGHREVSHREDSASYEKRTKRLIEQLQFTDFDFDVIALDPETVDEDDLRALGESDQSDVAIVLADLLQEHGGDGALSLWQERLSSGEKKIVAAFYFPDRIEVLGLKVSLNFERLGFKGDDDFWRRLDEIVARQIKALPVGRIPSTAAHGRPRKLGIATLPPMEPPVPRQDGGTEDVETLEDTAALEDAEDLIYRIKAGDTLVGISNRCYGDARFYKLIMEFNDIEDFDELKKGMKLVLPAVIEGVPLDRERCDL